MRDRRLTISDLAAAARCESQAGFDKRFGAAPVRRRVPRETGKGRTQPMS